MRAAGKQDIRRPFHIGHAPVRRATDDGHHFPFGIEGDFCFERRAALQAFLRQSDLRRRNQKSAFRWITDHLPRFLFFS